MFGRFSAVLLSAVIWATSSAEANDDREVTKALIQAWSGRELKVRSGRFEWTSNHFMSAQLFEHMAGVMGGAGPPVEDQTFLEAVHLTLDGTKLRFELEKSSWSNEQGQFVETPFISVFDDNVAQSLWTRNVTEYPSATIYRKKSHSEIDNVAMAPVMFALRPFGYGNPGFGFDPNNLEKSIATRVADAGQTIKLRKTNGERLLEVWVNPRQGFVISRFAISNSGRIRWQCTLEYDRTELPTPSRWILEGFGKQGERLETYDARMTRAEINSAVSSDVFTLEFPVGTHVFDQRTNKHFVVRTREAYREVLPSEMHLNHDDLMNTETGQPFRGQTLVSSRFRTVLLLAISLLLLVVGTLAFRRFRDSTLTK